MKQLLVWWCTGREAIEQKSKLSGQEKGTAPPMQNCEKVAKNE
jgi:hypothetical protein